MWFKSIITRVEIWISNLWFDLSVWGGWYVSYGEKREIAARHLLMKQFKIAGYKGVKLEDLLGEENDGWFQKYTMTTSQQERWRKYSIKYLQKKLDLTYEGAKKTFAWVDLMHGLKIEDK